MADRLAKTHANLRQILNELLPLEPIFHTKEFGLTRPDFETRMASDYWEIGASGRRYSREFILDFLTKSPPVNAAAAGWQCSDPAVRQLGPNTYLLTYRLLQGKRLSCRSTIWQKTEQRWCILYHQGTLASADG